jgi:NADH:ubiquinone reductase (H+-translocating)
MMMIHEKNARIVIIGGGFAGLSALNVLASKRDVHTITLIDRKQHFDMLPLIPEVLGGRIRKQNVTISYAAYCRTRKTGFIHANVQYTDIPNRIIGTDRGEIPFDYLLISTGAVVNFHGRDDLSGKTFTLRSTEDAEKIKKTVINHPRFVWVIAGGGYTGLEAATQIRRITQRQGLKSKILLVEHSSSILSGQPEWIKQYNENQLRELDIKIKLQTAVSNIEGNTVSFSDGSNIENARVIWSAGVRAPDFPTDSRLVTGEGGRIHVDGSLKLNGPCWAAGDSALIYQEKGEPLPMFSYLSQQQGRRAAENILREIAGEQPRPYKPKQYGFIIPLANGRASGKILGIRIKGFLGILIHHLASIYRSCIWKNRFGLIADLLKNGTGL